MIIRNAALLILLVFPLAASPDELSKDEQAVWKLEMAYWDHVKNNDVPAYRSLWDERFVGWPGFSKKPLGKKSIHEWIAQYHRDPAKKLDYELTLGSVRAYGDVVAAHYLVRYVLLSVDTGEEVGDERISRITHTWQRRGDTWQIVSGMSGTLIGTTEDD